MIKTSIYLGFVLFGLVNLVRAATSKGLRLALETAGPNFDDSNIFLNYGVGSMHNYLHPDELETLMADILNEFPEVVRTVEVGKTY